MWGCVCIYVPLLEILLDFYVKAGFMCLNLREANVLGSLVRVVQ